jgi:hypothetical protein
MGPFPNENEAREWGLSPAWETKNTSSNESHL